MNEYMHIVSKKLDKLDVAREKQRIESKELIKDLHRES